MVCELCLNKAVIKNKTTINLLVWVLQIPKANLGKEGFFSVCFYFKIYLLICGFKWQIIKKNNCLERGLRNCVDK